jgi:enamine deaminase RidA (YjgF/YER057c/UK114 family)
LRIIAILLVEENEGRRAAFRHKLEIDDRGNIGEDIGEQATLAIANLNAVLAEAGMTNANLAKLTIYLTDESLVPGFVAAAGAALPDPPPATTLLIVKALAAPPLQVEIEAVAAA